MIKLKYLLLTLVIAVSTFTHLYRINHTFVFHNDEARDVLIVKKMIDSKAPVLLGPQTSVGNMYLGPLYYYLMLPPLILADMNPVGPAIMVAIFGIMTSVLLFFLGLKKSGLLAGTIAGLFYALSPVMLHYSRSSWNPNLVPFFATLLLFAWSSTSRWSWLLLGICAGAIFQLHYVALVIVALITIAKFSQKPSVAQICLAVFGFFLISAPFWLFELRHDFVNTQAFLTFLKEGSQNADINSSYLSRLINSFSLIVQGIVGSASLTLTPVPTFLLSVSTILVFGFLPFIPQGIGLWYLLIGSSLIVSILREPLNVHYVSYLFPVVALALATLATTHRKLIAFTTTFLILALIWHFIPTLQYNLHEIDSVQVKRSEATANYIVTNAEGRRYNIVSTPGTYSTTIEYYLALSSNPPVTTLQDLVFDICEGRPCPASDTTSVLFYGSGPTHPALGDYLGHPAMNEFTGTREILKNELASHDIWVATMRIIR